MLLTQQSLIITEQTKPSTAYEGYCTYSLAKGNHAYPQNYACEPLLLTTAHGDHGEPQKREESNGGRFSRVCRILVSQRSAICYLLHVPIHFMIPWQYNLAFTPRETLNSAFCRLALIPPHYLYLSLALSHLGMMRSFCFDFCFKQKELTCILRGNRQLENRIRIQFST